MRTTALALLLASVATVLVPTRAHAQPAPTPAASQPAAKIPADAQAVFDRAVAAYRGAKGYSERLQTTMRQKATGLAKDAEPPSDQALTTRFVWADKDHFTFQTRDIAVYQNGMEATVYVRALGQYTQRQRSKADDAVFDNMCQTHPVYTALTAGEAGKPFARFVTVEKVAAEELNGRKGKRVTGTGLPPLPGFELAVPYSMWFADDTGLLGQAVYDMKSVMQAQLDRGREALPPQERGERPVIEQFLITCDWLEAKVSDQPPAESAVTFKPSPRDSKVEEFSTGDGDDSVQHATLNTPAPEVEVKTLDGKTVALKDLRGKVVLLQFWSSSNQLSTRALPVYNALNQQYGKRGVSFLSINQDDPSMIEQTRAQVSGKAVAMPIGLDPEKQVGNAFRVAVIPNTVIVDQEGVVRYVCTDFDPADQVIVSRKLDELLAGGKPGEPAKPAGNPPAVEPKKP